MRIPTRTVLLLAAAPLAAWPSGAHATGLAPARVHVCTCAFAHPAPLSWTARERFVQVDTPPARPRVVDPCTGRPPRAGEARRGVDPCTGEPVALDAPGRNAVDPNTGEPVRVAGAEPAGPSPAGPGAGVTPTNVPPTDVTSPALPAPRPEPPARPAAGTPARTTAPDPAAAARNRELLRLQALALRDVVRPGPAGSISVPTGFGVETGEFFVGAAYQARTRYTDEADAGLVVGTGIGSRRVLALEVAATSYSTIRGGGPGETGGLSFKLHRALPAEGAIAVGYENAVLWGDADADPALYAVASKVFRRTRAAGASLDAAVVTLGVGNGRFRSEEADLDDRETVNVFGAVGVRVARAVSVAADWTGQDVNAGVSIMPLRGVPLVVTPAMADLLGTAGDGPRFILSVGYGVGFRSLV
jgi:hypothetical protein